MVQCVRGEHVLLLFRPYACCPHAAGLVTAQAIAIRMKYLLVEVCDAALMLFCK